MELKRTWKKAISFMLALVMAFSFVPSIPARAEGTHTIKVVAGDSGIVYGSETGTMTFTVVNTNGLGELTVAGADESFPDAFKNPTITKIDDEMATIVFSASAASAALDAGSYPIVITDTNESSVGVNNACAVVVKQKPITVTAVAGPVNLDYSEDLETQFTNGTVDYADYIQENVETLFGTGADWKDYVTVALTGYEVDDDGLVGINIEPAAASDINKNYLITPVDSTDSVRINPITLVATYASNSSLDYMAACEAASTKATELGWTSPTDGQLVQALASNYVTVHKGTSSGEVIDNTSVLEYSLTQAAQTVNAITVSTDPYIVGVTSNSGNYVVTTTDTQTQLTITRPTITINWASGYNDATINKTYGAKILASDVYTATKNGNATTLTPAMVTEINAKLSLTANSDNQNVKSGFGETIEVGKHDLKFSFVEDDGWTADNNETPTEYTKTTDNYILKINNPGTTAKIVNVAAATINVTAQAATVKVGTAAADIAKKLYTYDGEALPGGEDITTVVGAHWKMGEESDFGTTNSVKGDATAVELVSNSNNYTVTASGTLSLTFTGFSLADAKINVKTPSIEYTGKPIDEESVFDVVDTDETMVLPREAYDVEYLTRKTGTFTGGVFTGSAATIAAADKYTPPTNYGTYTFKVVKNSEALDDGEIPAGGTFTITKKDLTIKLNSDINVSYATYATELNDLTPAEVLDQTTTLDNVAAGDAIKTAKVLILANPVVAGDAVSAIVDGAPVSQVSTSTPANLVFVKDGSEDVSVSNTIKENYNLTFQTGTIAIAATKLQVSAVEGKALDFVTAVYDGTKKDYDPSVIKVSAGTTAIEEGFVIQYAEKPTSGDPAESAWTTTPPSSTNACDKTYLIRAIPTEATKAIYTKSDNEEISFKVNPAAFTQGEGSEFSIYGASNNKVTYGDSTTAPNPVLKLNGIGTSVVDIIGAMNAESEVIDKTMTVTWSYVAGDVANADEIASGWTNVDLSDFAATFSGQPAGDYVLRATITKYPNYKTGADATFYTGFTVETQKLSVVISDAEKVFGEADPEQFAYTVKSGDTVLQTVLGDGTVKAGSVVSTKLLNEEDTIGIDEDGETIKFTGAVDVADNTKYAFAQKNSKNDITNGTLSTKPVKSHGDDGKVNAQIHVEYKEYDGDAETPVTTYTYNASKAQGPEVACVYVTSKADGTFDPEEDYTVEYFTAEIDETTGEVKKDAQNKVVYGAEGSASLPKEIGSYKMVVAAKAETGNDRLLKTGSGIIKEVEFTINKKVLVISGLTATGRFYDGTDVVELDSSAASLLLGEADQSAAFGDYITFPETAHIKKDANGNATNAGTRVIDKAALIEWIKENSVGYEQGGMLEKYDLQIAGTYDGTDEGEADVKKDVSVVISPIELSVTIMSGSRYYGQGVEDIVFTKPTGSNPTYLYNVEGTTGLQFAITNNSEAVKTALTADGFTTNCGGLINLVVEENGATLQPKATATIATAYADNYTVTVTDGTLTVNPLPLDDMKESTKLDVMTTALEIDSLSAAAVASAAYTPTIVFSKGSKSKALDTTGLANESGQENVYAVRVYSSEAEANADAETAPEDTNKSIPGSSSAGTYYVKVFAKDSAKLTGSVVLPFTLTADNRIVVTISPKDRGFDGKTEFELKDNEFAATYYKDSALVTDSEAATLFGGAVKAVIADANAGATPKKITALEIGDSTISFSETDTVVIGNEEADDPKASTLLAGEDLDNYTLELRIANDFMINTIDHTATVKLTDWNYGQYATKNPNGPVYTYTNDYTDLEKVGAQAAYKYGTVAFAEGDNDDAKLDKMKAAATTSATLAEIALLPAGTYALAASLPAKGNYKATTVYTSFKVEKAPLAVKADAITIMYPETIEDAELTYKVTGLVNDDKETDVLQGELAINGTTIEQGSVGLKSAYTSKYEINFTSATLTRKKLDLSDKTNVKAVLGRETADIVKDEATLDQGAQVSVTLGEDDTPLDPSEYEVHYAKGLTDVTGVPTEMGVYTVRIEAKSGSNDIEKSQTVGTYKVAKAITEDMITIDPVTYTGDDLTPDPVIVDDEYTLVKGTDYTVTYENNKAAGTATAKIGVPADSLYTVPDGGVEKTFTIAPADISGATFAAISSYTYDGAEKKPTAVSGTFEGKALTADDYELSFAGSDYTNASTECSVTVTGKGNFTGSTSLTYSILPASISEAEITIAEAEYTGEAIKPVPTVKLGDATLNAETDYDLDATSKNTGYTAVGTYNAYVTGKGNYTGQKTFVFKINPRPEDKKELDDETVTIELVPSSVSYTGAEIDPAQKITGLKIDGELVDLADYTIKKFGTTSCKNAGEYYVSITAKSTAAYKGSTMEAFTITPAEINSINLATTSADVTYTGESQTPALVVRAGSITTPLTLGTDYTLTPQTAEAGNYVDAKTYTVTVEPVGTNFVNAAGNDRKSVAYTIKPAEISEVTLTAATGVYNGQAHTPTVATVKAGELDVPAAAYTQTAPAEGVTYTDVGTYDITVTPTSTNYVNKATAAKATYTISPAEITEITLKNPTVTATGENLIPEVDKVYAGTGAAKFEVTNVAATDTTEAVVNYTTDIDTENADAYKLPGTFTITVTAASGNFTDAETKASAEYVINPVSFKDAVVTFKDVSYNTKEQAPEIDKITLGTGTDAKELNKDDFTIVAPAAGVSYKNAGDYEVSIKAKETSIYAKDETAKGTYTIDPVEINLTVAGLAATNKTYDGTTEFAVDATKAAVTASAKTGTIDPALKTKAETDAVLTIPEKANSDKADVGTYTLKVSGITVADKNAKAAVAATATTPAVAAVPANFIYTVADAEIKDAQITPAELTAAIGTIKLTDKVYDGTTEMAVTGEAEATGVIEADAKDVKVVPSVEKVEAADANVGDKKADVALKLDGTKAANYTLKTEKLEAAGKITAKEITVEAGTVKLTDKIYDGTATMAVEGAPVVTGVLEADAKDVTATVVETEATVADANVGEKTAKVTAKLVENDKAKNYVLKSAEITAAGNITPKEVKVTGLVLKEKVYDGTTEMHVDSNALKLDGVLTADVTKVTLNFPEKLEANDKNASKYYKNDDGKWVYAADKTATIKASELSLNQAVANYVLAAEDVTVAGSITKRGVYLEDMKFNNKYYDGSKYMVLTSTTGVVKSGVIEGDDVAFETKQKNYVITGTKNAGSKRRKLTKGLWNISGKDALNYKIAAGPTATGTIKKVELKSVTLKNKTVTYNGKKQKPVISSILGSEGKKILAKNCKIEYLRNGEATKDFTSQGKITVKVTATGNADAGYNWKGTKSVVYTIK